ncbi:Spy/CpxP family protein refolding chaperone [Pseudomonas fontis]|uniref:LTXXQ domain protein n=1 Tax=Pseudomonas fontis TaxID=2942633 RepID=A0ABT5NR30_9PSED|nr:Spy/CpxP family protein refolding chaperone [Pseudomonas fontis]MDD0972576.1 LTXXQ domain protein [Pseudomonas fontis]MDD0990620.1 LTXXQ domain protein [Pseudomonas fontis]
MRKTLIALMFAAALPTVAMAMPEGGGPQFGGMHHRGDAPFAQLDLSREQRQQIGKLMGEQMKARQEITERYMAKLPAADQKAMKDEIKAKHDKAQADIRALLKPDQQKQFDEMAKKREERRAEWAEFKAWKAEKATKAQ